MSSADDLEWDVPATALALAERECLRVSRTAPVCVLHAIFEAQADLGPDAIALDVEGIAYSYGEVEMAANRLARWLRHLGAGPGAVVGLWLPRGYDAHVALLAILKSGAAYVPIDPEYPLDRVVYILENSGAPILVSDDEHARGLVDRNGWSDGTVVRTDGDAAAIAACESSRLTGDEVSVGPRDRCYLIYTSGSTGRPKGVEIEHRSACNFVWAESTIFDVGPADRVYQGFSLAFDASVEEIWLAYRAGATLVVASHAMAHAGPSLPRLLERSGVTVLSCVPTLLSMMDDEPSTVRLLIVGGEPCPPELVRRWCVGGRRMVNTYGPTEATVVATWAECHPDRPVTIGRPLPNYRALILDDQLQPLPPGVAGELHLGGIGLARGYVGLPEVTAAKFVSDPWGEFDDAERDSGLAPDEIHPGPAATTAPRLYKTGDLCRWTDDGEIEYLGRIDGQVKIRGFRVELAEIEAVLIDRPEIAAAAVAYREDEPGRHRLVAYVVPCPQSVVDTLELRRAARDRLPVYMVPELIEVLDRLPTLSSGKIDRTGLPAPRGVAEGPGELSLDQTMTVSDHESALLGVWRGLFAPHPVTRTDDFFLDLGGHSLLAARMVSQLRSDPRFANLSMLDVYQAPTVERLAARIELHHARGPVAGDGTRPASWRFTLAGVLQMLMLYFVLGVSSIQWLAPYLTYSYLQDDDYGVVESLVGAAAALMLVYPAMLALVVAAKWLCLGRVRAGSYPLWGSFYLRWWLVRALESTVPIHYLTGTPLLGIYYRLMGARIGHHVYLGSDSFGAYDLLQIGDNSCIGADASVLGYRIADGRLWLGAITIGRDCFVGTRAALGDGVRMGDGSRLEDLSMLPPGAHVPAAETWIGSPARPADGAASRPAPAPPSSRIRRLAVGLVQTAGVFLVPLMVVSAILPGMAVMHHLNQADDYYWYLWFSPLIALSFVVLLSLEIAAVKWLVLGRVRPAVFSLDSVYYVRKWMVDQLLELSIDVLGPLYSTLYLAPWYRLLGAQLGQRAEVSTASFISPDLLRMDDESFLADIVSLGAPRVEAGAMTIAPVHVGKRTFVGNSAVVPPGTHLGDDCLIGCLSVPPCPSNAASAGGSWLGSPALRLPNRDVNDHFGAETTYVPTRRLVWQRAAVEFARVTFPSAGFICVASLMFSAVSILRDEIDGGWLMLLFPVIYGASCLALTLAVVALKWLVIGRYRPAEAPLWSLFVWRTEFITALHDFFAVPILLDALRGTPFLAWYLRLMGARVGRRVVLDTTQFTEFDLVAIGDEAELNSDATLQTHLFEDRVMKMSHVRIGSRCRVGAESLVLYDTRMEDGAALGELSLLMKGEQLPAGTNWHGSPAQRS